MKQELREPALYNAIIKTIAESASRFNEITTKVGFLVELQKLILTQ